MSSWHPEQQSREWRLHIPGTPDNKFESGYGISGAKRKQLLWERAVEYAAAHEDRRVIIMGDFNTGFRIDTEGEMFRLSRYMTSLIDIGFVDTWRYLHRNVRDYTWYSKRKNKGTANSEDLNGFRLDYIFVSPALRHSIAKATILHQPRTAGVSDHASVLAEINMSEESRDQTGLSTLSETTPQLEPNGNQLGETCDSSGSPVGNVVGDRRIRIRFDLALGALEDMICALNGENAVQPFRPTHVTAEWVAGVLKQVQIWGPFLRKDGSLGKRMLDHQWKRPIAAGGVRYSDLPPIVAARLESYRALKHFAPPPQ
ncbi:endonuclease/exonuclease/phosphatase family protein [Mycobacterium palustre]|uniref:Endonuclease/exonuclease/phosphatase domain-containing protein n=1 Tax=Mycobacterium palustre TaxID=153971 RepID=A0A1X1ZTI0_9MYCO|nr:endonuclease/exonuclease/phosphatase family protein [Mycobacterium palustre]MCV7102667.1 endonuclease/exonuclease/phosphatase [Mycobacterium palustre]ORW26733.1 hypothetical protein AWC19_03365 [Mycobacterium palustre]